MVKTQAVQENPKWRHLQAKSKEIVQDFMGSPKWGFSRRFLVIFRFLMRKD